MNAHRYRHAPIIEAVIEFRFQSELDEKFLNDIARKLKGTFPNQEDQKRREYQVEIPVDAGLDPSAKVDKTREQPIRRLTDADGARLVLLTPNAIGVSRFPPYGCFDDLRSDAELAWDTSYKLSGVRRLSRIGMRYINRIDLPYDDRTIVDFEKYLNLRINIPEKYDTIGNYSLVFELPLDGISCVAKVRSSIGEPALIDHASFFLDIDIVRNKDLPVKRADIFHLLEDMRNAKNEMFEEFITDKARAIFDAE